MEILVGSEQMKRCDKNTIEHFKVPSLVLMERAALGVVEEIEARLTPIPGRAGRRRALCACGHGNNGGDGVAVARMLSLKGYDAAIAMPPGRDRVSEETGAQLEIASMYGIPILEGIPEGEEYDVIVDALFGIGLSRDVGGVYGEFLARMNEKGGLKVAVDIPSGIHADSGAVMGTAFRADLTVVFAFAKPGILLHPGADYAGEVRVKDIGISRESFLGEAPTMYRATAEDLEKLPKRRSRTNKGSYGKLLVVAGKKDMAGAAYLCGKAAYAVGTGMVKIVTPEANRVILQQLLPEAILASYKDGKPGKEDAQDNSPRRKSRREKEIMEELLHDLGGWADAVVAGPGLGTGKTARMMVQSVLADSQVPVVLDADGLNIVAESPEWLKQSKAPVIVTPHVGEMSRLLREGIPTIQDSLIPSARDFARKFHVTCVLKDARTVTALPDGTTYLNTSGNNGMAVAGSGDTLSGILGGLIAQGMEPPLAAPIGVYLHGAAGDIAAGKRGKRALMPGDIIEGAAWLLREMEEGNAS